MKLVLYTFQQSFKYINCTYFKCSLPIGFGFLKVGYNPRQMTIQNQKSYQDRVRKHLQEIVAEGTHQPYSLRSYRENTITETVSLLNCSEADLLDFNADYVSKHLKKDSIPSTTRHFFTQNTSIVRSHNLDTYWNIRLGQFTSVKISPAGFPNFDFWHKEKNE